MLCWCRHNALNASGMAYSSQSIRKQLHGETDVMRFSLNFSRICCIYCCLLLLDWSSLRKCRPLGHLDQALAALSVEMSVEKSMHLWCIIAGVETMAPSIVQASFARRRGKKRMSRGGRWFRQGMFGSSYCRASRPLGRGCHGHVTESLPSDRTVRIL